MATAREFIYGFAHLLFPAVCNGCGRVLAVGQDSFCPACRSALLCDALPTCPRCAASVGPYSETEKGCAECRSEHFCFEAAVRFGPYDGLLRDVILRMKHQSGEGLAENIGILWAKQAADRLLALRPQVIVPVPLHWWRRLSRGYNQSAALAGVLGDCLRIPCLAHGLRRVRATPQQTRQSPTQRRVNVRGAFRVRGTSLRGKSILLVDDVMTTGSTCNEAARALLNCGAARVVVAILARGGG